MDEFVEKISKELTKDLFAFYYQGSFLSKLGINILDVLEKNIESVLSKKVTKRAFFFGVEIIQNIEKYSANSPDIVDSIALIKNEKGIQLVSENAIRNKDIEKLEKHINNVGNSSKDELKAMYFSRLKNTLDNDKKSPGLGFIELNRKGENNITYNFEKVNEEFSNFKLQVIMSDAENENMDSTIYNLIKNEYKNDKAAVFYTGLFNNKLLSPLIHLIEGLDLIENKTVVSKYQHCIIEMIQNANEHGINEENISGFFSLVQSGDYITTSCCNIIRNDVDLVSIVEDLNTKSYEEIKEINRAKLMDFDTDGGLGFIQLAQYSHPSPLKSKTFYIGDSYKFFYIESQFKVDGK